MAGGWPSNNDTIDYVTIASLGNALDFGNLNENIGGGPPGASSPTRGLFCGGYHPSPALTCRNTIQFVTIATTGNAQDFGDTGFTGFAKGSTSSPTRGVFIGGATPTVVNTIEYNEIATEGDSVDFGDIGTAGAWIAATSNGHGGL